MNVTPQESNLRLTRLSLDDAVVAAGVAPAWAMSYH